MNSNQTSIKIQRHVQQLQMGLAGVPSTHILNFDEVHLTDELGIVDENSEWTRNCIFKRGAKKSRRWTESYKFNTSILFAGTADGKLLPPFVLYKSEKNPGRISPSWQSDFPPPKAYYSSSETGWFDSKDFRFWFQAVVVPWAKRLVGRKIIIGDNKSILSGKKKQTEKVLNLVNEFDVAFYFLPDHCNHVTQPLDISLCHHVKKAWKNTLTKSASLGKRIKREDFPIHLKSIMMTLERIDIEHGFRESGIFPFSSEKAVKIYLQSPTIRPSIPVQQSAIKPPRNLQFYKNLAPNIPRMTSKSSFQSRNVDGFQAQKVTCVRTETVTVKTAYGGISSSSTSQSAGGNEWITLESLEGIPNAVGKWCKYVDNDNSINKGKDVVWEKFNQLNVSDDAPFGMHMSRQNKFKTTMNTTQIPDYNPVFFGKRNSNCIAIPDNHQMQPYKRLCIDSNTGGNALVQHNPSGNDKLVICIC